MRNCSAVSVHTDGVEPGLTCVSAWHHVSGGEAHVTELPFAVREALSERTGHSSFTLSFLPFGPLPNLFFVLYS